MKISTEEKDDLTVHKYKEGKKELVELLVESDIRGALVFLTPKEAERLGNALIKAAQPKKQKKAPTEAQKERRGETDNPA